MSDGKAPESLTDNEGEDELTPSWVATIAYIVIVIVAACMSYMTITSLMDIQGGIVLIVLIAIAGWIIFLCAVKRHGILILETSDKE